MSIDYNLLRVEIDVEALVHNYKLLHRMGGNAMPVVKSDAYGHGLRRTSLALEQAGARTLAVGTVAEAVTLRGHGFTGEILALLGPRDAADDAALFDSRITPCISSFEQLHRLAPLARERSLPIVLKFDTGMARLGFDIEHTPALVDFLRQESGLDLSMVASHLATADEPEQADFARLQGARFRDICQALAPLDPFDACLANSAGLLAFPELRLDAQRPGIALYGANPFFGTGWEDRGLGLRQAMQVSAPVLQVRELEAGQTVSYGRTFSAPHAMRIAIVAAGYADGYSRNLSSRRGGPACMLVHGERAPVVGRVCMQMTAIDVSSVPEVRPGERVWLLGGGGGNAIRCEELAAWWGTIPYEVFCILGLNPRRRDAVDQA